MTKIILDMNNPTFQKSLFDLEKSQQRALLNSLRKIINSTWEEFYTDKGINWELISQKSKKGNNIYSFRFSQKYRGTARREGNYLVLVGLFPDHDGAYK